MASQTFRFPKPVIRGTPAQQSIQLTENLRAIETWLQAYVTVTDDIVIGTVSDIVLTSPVDGEVLRFNGTNWINNTLAEAGISAVGHAHVEADISDLQAYLTDITGQSIGDLSDVTIPGSFSNRDVLVANGAGTFIASALVEMDISDLGAYLEDITGEALSTLADVTITSIADGEVLRWNGAGWVNNTLAELGVSATAHTHVEADITDLGSYMPLGGGTFTGVVKYGNNVTMEFLRSGGADGWGLVTGTSGEFALYDTVISGPIRFLIGGTGGLLDDLIFYAADGTTDVLHWDESASDLILGETVTAEKAVTFDVTPNIGGVSVARIPTQIMASRTTTLQTNIASGANFAWNQTDREDWTGHDPVTNNGRIVCDEAGFYHVDLNVALQGLVNGKWYRVRIQVDSAGLYADYEWTQSNTSGEHTFNIGTTVEMSASSYFTAILTHNETVSSETVDLRTGDRSSMRVTKLF